MLYFVLAALITAADQIVKVLIRTGMKTGASFDVIPGLLSITHVENRGAAFGMLEGQSAVLLVIPVVIIVLILVFAARSDLGTIEKVSLSMIAAGGVGNLIDRLLFGQVTDMISVSFFPPVFNVADIAVTCGVALLIIMIFWQGARDKGDGNGTD